MTTKLITDSQHYIREVIVNYGPKLETGCSIREPQQVAVAFRKIATDNSREHFVAFYLDGSSYIVSYSTVSIGTANKVTVHPRDIFQRAILAGAVSVVVAHNHPSGDLIPSDADRQITTGLAEAGKLLSIPLLDHVIVSDTGYYSFSNAGHLAQSLKSAF